MRGVCDELSRGPQPLARSKSVLYGGDRTVCTLWTDRKCPVPGGHSEKTCDMGASACFRPLMRGTSSRVRSCPVGWELLMPQPLMRHIARRAVQGAIVAAGILVVLLVFSRQAHAAISTPASAPAP